MGSNVQVDDVVASNPEALREQALRRVTLGCGIGRAFNARDVDVRRPITEDDIRAEMDRLRSAH